MSVPATATGVASPAPRRQPRRRLPRWWFVAALVAVLAAAVAAASGHRRRRPRRRPAPSRATLIATMPIMLAGLGGLWSERAGVVNIGLEGMMILGTWGAGYFGYHYGAWAGVARRDRDGHARRPAARHRHGHLRRRPHRLRRRDQHHRARRGAVPRRAHLHRAARRRPDPVAEDPGRPDDHDRRRSATRSATSRRRTSFFVSELAAVLRALVDEPVAARRDLAAAARASPGACCGAPSFGLRLRSCGESPVGRRVARRQRARYKFVAVLISGGLAGLGRRLPGDGRVEQLPRRPDRRPRLHRPRRDDLRQLATRRPARRRRPVRLHRDARPARRRRLRARAAARASRCWRSRPPCWQARLQQQRAAVITGIVGDRASARSTSRSTRCPATSPG